MAVQNASLTLLVRWSRVIAETDVAIPGYVKTTLVFTCETVKIFVAFLLLMWENGSGPVTTMRKVYHETIDAPIEFMKLLIPASLYVLQNNLVLVAAENLEGPLLAVFSQAKIFTTAIFSVIILRRTLERRQWFALLLLAGGVCIVQVSQSPKNRSDGDGDSGSRNVMIGFLATLASCCTSGFAGVYFEKVLKESSISLWVRNIHLACIGVVVSYGTTIVGNDSHLIQKNGFFAGYNGVVWLLVGVQAFGGLLVAAVVKYTDSILKGFATSVAILLTCLTSQAFFNFPVTKIFILGALLVVYAVFLYSGLLEKASIFKGLRNQALQSYGGLKFHALLPNLWTSNLELSELK